MPKHKLEISGEKLIITSLKDNPFEPTIYEFDLKDIESIEVVEKEEISLIDTILQCEDLEQALMLTSDPPTQQEEQALDELKLRLEPKRLKAQIERIHSCIGEEIKRSQSKLTVESVLEFMCENILGIKQIDSMLDLSAEIELLNNDKIKWAIQKLESVGW